jgi:hypothetical protein
MIYRYRRYGELYDAWVAAGRNARSTLGPSAIYRSCLSSPGSTRSIRPATPSSRLS